MQGEPKQTELVWPEKETEVNPPILPFQTIETVNEPRIREKPLDFGSESYDRNWKNKLIWGDNKYILSSLKREYEGKFDLIYIDPPFATGANFSISIELGGEAVTKEPSVIEELAYRDTWGKGLQSYLSMMYERLVLMKDLLSQKGSIYVHSDWRVNSYLRILLDEIFGQDYFQNEIVWHYSGWNRHGDVRFNRRHDTLLYYSKTDAPSFNSYAIPYDSKEEYVSKRKQKVRTDEDGREYVLSDAGGGERVKRYLDNAMEEGRPADDVWDLDKINNSSKEFLNYPTQKPESLIERVITASSNAGSLVGDFFCGSGTTGAVAERLGRRWIMSDLSKFAIQTTRKRLLNLHNADYNEYDKPSRPFVIANLGNYQKYKFTENGHPPVEEYQEFILELYEATSIEGYSFLQGRKGSTFVHIASVDGIVTEDEVKHTTEECRNAAGGNKLDILGWDFEMGLDRMVDQIGEMYGVDVNLKVIPKEATEIKDAAKEGEHIKFFDLNYMEIDHQVEDKELRLEIAGFVLANPEYIPEEVRKSVEEFTDYIDYWAVDFDYQDDTFHNMWQTFRTKDRKQLETSCKHEYEEPGTKKVLVKVIDVFGNDTNELLEVGINV